MIYYYEHTGAISEVLENSLKCTILIKGSWMKKNTKKYIQFLSFPIDIRIHLVADVLITSVCKLLSWCFVWKKSIQVRIHDFSLLSWCACYCISSILIVIVIQCANEICVLLYLAHKEVNPVICLSLKIISRNHSSEMCDTIFLSWYYKKDLVKVYNWKRSRIKIALTCI